MTLIADVPARPDAGLFTFLARELAPRPGRVAACLRIAGSCTIVVALAMLYQIPLPAYMAYVVFLVSKDEAATTLLTGVVAAIALTLAVGLSLLFYTLDASEPALRVPLLAVSTFTAMFLVRVVSLGPVAFLAGFILVLSQTLIDGIPNVEALTHLVLWLWVVAVVPDLLTVLVNLLIGGKPGPLARGLALDLLGQVAAALRSGTIPHDDQAQILRLLELRQRAGMLDHDLRSRAAIDTLLIETLAELSMLLRLLALDTPAAIRQALADRCDGCATAFAHETAPLVRDPLAAADLAALSPSVRPVVVAMLAALSKLGEGIVRRRTESDPPAPRSAKSMLVLDAFSNPDHARFALKTTIAVMAAYVIYSGLDWRGISTSITTCFFVALGSLGETMHKLTLRLTGAAIGGLAGGICIIYLLPHMIDIGDLSLLIAGFAFVSAWLATSSERLSYAGMQMAFAFFLGVLQGYGPSTDLTVLRDRIVGILLGNFLMSLVFSTLWPRSAGDRVRASFAAALRALGQMLAEPAKAGTRLAAVRALADARRFASLDVFELTMLPADAVATTHRLDAADRIAAAAFARIEIDPAPDREASAWLIGSADRVAAKQALVPPDDALASTEAELLLRSEMNHVVAL